MSHARAHPLSHVPSGPPAAERADPGTPWQTVLVPVGNGTEEIEAVCLIDILRRAGADVTVASVEPELEVQCAKGVRLTADVPIERCEGTRFDLIVLPGGPGASHLRDCEPLTRMLKHQAASGGAYGALCASPAVVLAPHGLLRGKRATAYPSNVKDLPDQSHAEERVVFDGNVVTSRGPGTALEFALGCVGLLYGHKKMADVAHGILMPHGWERSVHALPIH